MALVRKTQSPQTMGDDQPRPGISRFHATFSVADQRSGSVVPRPMPRDFVPRNCGQFSWAPTYGLHVITNSDSKRTIIFVELITSSILLKSGTCNRILSRLDWQEGSRWSSPPLR